MALIPEAESRYYPNFIESREGNKVGLLTEVIGGTIHRRTVTLSEDTDMNLERSILYTDAMEEAQNIWRKHEDKYTEGFDGKLYGLDNLPSGLTILDVLNEARRDGVISLSGNDLQSTEEDLERYIYEAVKRNNQNK
jgi:hypothetical protein